MEDSDRVKLFVDHRSKCLKHFKTIWHISNSSGQNMHDLLNKQPMLWITDS